MANTLADDIDDVICDPKTYGSEHRYHEVFAQLRREDPVHWTAPKDYRPFWAVTRHADIMAVELNSANFLNDPRQFLLTIADEEMLLAQTGSRGLENGCAA